MSKIDVEAHDKRVIAEHLGLSVEQVNAADNLRDDLSADSLDLVEILMLIEDEFGIEISDEDAEKIHTVQQAIDYIAGRTE